MVSWLHTLEGEEGGRLISKSCPALQWVQGPPSPTNKDEEKSTIISFVGKQGPPSPTKEETYKQGVPSPQVRVCGSGWPCSSQI